MSFIDKFRPFNGRGLCEDNEIFNTVNHVRGMHINISRGLDPDKMAVAAFGERTAGGPENNTPIWPDGIIRDAGAGGIQMYVRSTSALDVLGSTGVAALNIHYIDGNGDLVDAVISMNGLTRVPLPTLSRYIQEIHIATPGQGYAAGTIYVDDGTDPVIYGQMSIGEAKSLSCFRMVPRGYRLFIDDAVASSVSATSDAISRIRLVANSIDNDLFTNPILLVPFASTGIQNNGIGKNFRSPIPIIEYSIVGGVHTSDKGCTVSVSWWGRFERAT